MQVEIYSLQRILFEGNAESVNCKTAKGELTVLDNHEALISTLAEGPVKVKPAADKDGVKEGKIFPIKGGFIQVTPHHSVRLLVEE